MGAPFAYRRTKVIDMWKVISGPKNQVERLQCWDLILADSELARTMGKGDQTKGKAMLEVMKAMRAMDKNGDGVIYEEEFQRLYLAYNLVAAEDAVAGNLEPSYILTL